MGQSIVNPADAFDRVYCVNLDRRPDRWARFAEGLPADWPFPAPIRVAGCDGKKMPHPSHWRAGGGAWGCYRSHLRLIEQCLNEDVRSVLLLEDDATFTADFSARVAEWLRLVPADWEMLYLGGQHLKAKHHPPIEVRPGVWQPYNINRTHAWALQGAGLRAVYAHLVAADWHPKHHIDHRLGVLHQERKLRIYCPPVWLVGQHADRSNISGRDFAKTRFWPAAEAIKPASPVALARGLIHRGANATPLAMAQDRPIVAILGTHSSGSSALAGCLWHCGVWFGQQADLVGYWGKDSPARGGEHRALARLCELAWPFRSVKPAKQPRWIRRQLAAFVAARRREGLELPPHVPIAVKYPQLALAGQQLQTVCGPGLRLIICDRPLVESIASLIRRTNATPEQAAAIGAHQRWIAKARDAVAATMPAEDVLHVAHADLLADPAGTIARICTWLDLQPIADQLAAAVASVHH